MFEVESSHNLFIRFAKSFGRWEYAFILISGLVFGLAGVYAAWFDLSGEYKEFGIAFFAWVPLQVPVYLLAISLPRDFYFPITFAWWFFLGSSITFSFLFLADYFLSLIPE